MIITEAIVELSTMLSDTLQQVSPDRLTAAMKSAWRDGHVATPVVDNSLTYDSSVYEYTLPSTINLVENIKVKQSSSSNPTDISADLYEVVDGVIRFNENARNYLTTGEVIVLRGKKKLSTTDEIPDSDEILIEYVINLAAWMVLKQLGYTKAVAFLNNDTSMSELINFRRDVERDLKYLRTQLQTSYQDN